MIHIPQILEVLDAPMIPLHQKHPRHQPVRDEHTHAGEVLVPEAPEQRLVEAAHPIVRVGRALAVRDPVEEMSVISPLLPHPLHGARARLEVAKVLFAQARLFPDFYGVAGEWGGGGLVGREGAEDAFGGLARAAVGRGVELEGVVWAEHGAEAVACLFGLGVAFGGELYAVVGNALVDFAVTVSFGLLGAFQNTDLLRRDVKMVNRRHVPLYIKHTCAWRMIMIIYMQWYWWSVVPMMYHNVVSGPTHSRSTHDGDLSNYKAIELRIADSVLK